MKRHSKTLVLILIIAILFSGVVTANSINGLFEGFQMVNVYVNGKKVEGDVPAINFKGRTMVPVRFISEELGADVKWDSKTASVHVEMKKDEEYSKMDINKMKAYSMVANQYRMYYDLGKDLQNLYWYFDVLAGNIIYTHNIDYGDYIVNNLESYRETFDIVNGSSPVVIRDAKDSGVDIDFNDVSNDFDKAIRHYWDAYNEIMKYYKTGKTADFQAYIDNATKANILVSKHLSSLLDNYVLYYFGVQFY